MEKDLRKPVLKDLHLRLTNDCNFKCKYCYAATDRFLGMEIKFKTLKTIINEAKTIGCKKVTLTGGEPLLYSNIIPLIDFLIGKKINIAIETNGSKLDELYDKLGVKLNRISIIVSYDPPEIRGKKNMKIVFKNLKLLAKNQIKFSTQSIITKKTKNSIENLLNDLVALKPIKSRFFLNYNRINKGKLIHPMKYKEALEIKKIIESRSSIFQVLFPGLFDGCTSSNCGWGFERCEIMPNGDITSCGPTNFFDKDFVAGNIYRDNFIEIWYNSEHFKNIRSFTQSSYEYPCNICFEFNKCRGACRAIGYSCYGKLLGPFPYCKEYYEDTKTSFIIVKPDAVKYINNIIKELNEKGIEVIYRKKLYLSDEEFKVIYKRLDKEYKNRLKLYIQSGPIILLIVHTESDTIRKVLNIVGKKITSIDEWSDEINSNIKTLRSKYSGKFFNKSNFKYAETQYGIYEKDLVIANGFHRPLDPEMVKIVFSLLLTKEEKKLIMRRINNEL